MLQYHYKLLTKLLILHLQFVNDILESELGIMGLNHGENYFIPENSRFARWQRLD